MRRLKKLICLGISTVIFMIGSGLSWAQDQDRDVATDSAAVEGRAQQDDVSKALDSTATQWSFQFAYEEADWKEDEVNNQTRPPGLDNFWQLRVVAPLVFEKFTLLPRLTLRHYENLRTGESGLGNTELFGLIIPKNWDWGTGDPLIIKSSLVIGLHVGQDALMSKWKIRPATVRDTTALSECIEAAYSVYASRITDLPAVSEGISDDIANQIVWVAEINRTIVGGIILIPKEHFLVLANVAVHPKSSGLGLGRTLIELADRVCLELGLNEIRLSTHVDIPENIRLYKHLGWQETGRTGNRVDMRRFVNAG